MLVAIERLACGLKFEQFFGDQQITNYFTFYCLWVAFAVQVILAYRPEALSEASDAIIYLCKPPSVAELLLTDFPIEWVAEVFELHTLPDKLRTVFKIRIT